MDIKSELNKWRILYSVILKSNNVQKKTLKYLCLNFYVTCKSKKVCYWLLSHIRKYWAKPRVNKIDETEVRTRRIEIDQENIEYINSAYNEEITYWKKGALDRVLNKWKEKELVDLAPTTPSKEFY